MVYTLRFFSLQNAVCFIIHNLVPVLFTFHIQIVLKFKKNNSGTKRLIDSSDRRVKLITHHLPMQRLRISGAISLFRPTLSLAQAEPTGLSPQSIHARCATLLVSLVLIRDGSTSPVASCPDGLLLV